MRVEEYVRDKATSGQLSREGLRYAIEKFPGSVRSRILAETRAKRPRAEGEEEGWKRRREEDT
jgi:hypothetical protein